MGSLQSFVIYKYLCPLRMRVRHVFIVKRRWLQGPPARQQPSSWFLSGLRPLARRWHAGTTFPCAEPSGSRLRRVIDFILQKYEGTLLMSLPSEGSPEPTCEGDLWHGDLRGLVCYLLPYYKAKFEWSWFGWWPYWAI
jgi:hypothetical protein